VIYQDLCLNLQVLVCNHCDCYHSTIHNIFLVVLQLCVFFIFLRNLLSLEVRLVNLIQYGFLILGVIHWPKLFYYLCHIPLWTASYYNHLFRCFLATSCSKVIEFSLTEAGLTDLTLQQLLLYVEGEVQQQCHHGNCRNTTQLLLQLNLLQ